MLCIERALTLADAMNVEMSREPTCWLLQWTATDGSVAEFRGTTHEPLRAVIERWFLDE